MPVIINGTSGDISASSLTGVDTGKILQVQQFIKTDAASASITQDTNWTSHGVAVNITPSSASNKIIISGYITVGNDRNDGIFGILYKNGSALTAGIGDQGVSSGTRATTGVEIDYNFVVTPIPIYFIDTAGSTSQQTYTMALNITTNASSTVYVNRPQTSDNYVWNATTISLITAMEVAA
tara:strand:- start:65 stop:607 length:543 start_codon:yes stop_codon:yes gene_type:complete